LNHDARAQFQPGEFITYSQDSWGGAPSPGGAAELLLNNFDTVYSPFGGAEAGINGAAGYSMLFTGPSPALTYLPASGGAGTLNSDLIDPTSSASGVLGGFVFALQLNIDFEDAGFLSGTASTAFADLILSDFPAYYAALNGLSVRQFLSHANQHLGGRSSHFTSDDIAVIAQDLTLAFEGGTPSQFAQDHLRVGLPGDFNQNGLVDAADYVLWRKGLGTTFIPEHYNDWRANFGRTTAGSGISSVPEPATLLLQGIGALVLVMSRRNTPTRRKPC
jgi:hypothetical protein